MQDAINKISGLSTAFELFAEKTCTKEKLKGTLTQKLKNKTDEIGTANIFTAETFKLLALRAKEALIAMMHNPLTWVVAAIASIGLLIKGYDALIGRQEKSSRQKIEGLDEDISKLDEEIKSLEELQSKLEEAKGDKSKLAQIQTELNDAIGETSGLLNAEGKAYDIANAKLKANIELKKQQRKQAQQDKVDESKNLFDNNTFEKDWAFDVSGEQMRGYGSTYVTSMEWYNSQSEDSDIKQKYKTQQEYSNSLLEFFDFNPSDWDTYWSEQVDTAYDVFEDTINSYDGAGGQDFIKNLISNMVRGGFDLSEINKIVQQVIDNTEMQDAINKYWESLVNPDIDSEEALQAVKKIFDDIIVKKPELKSFFDNFYNGIVAGGKAATDTSSDIDKMTVSLDDLKNASEKISTLSSAFKEISDNGYITTESLSKIKEATGLSDEAWKSYQTTLMNAKAGSDEFNQAMSDLTIKILDATFKKDGLINATEEEIAAVLRENNVANASAVAHDYVTKNVTAETKAKAKNVIESAKMNGGIDTLISNLHSEAEGCGITSEAFGDLVASEIIFNNNDLSVSGKIEKLATLSKQVYGTASAYTTLYNAMNGGATSTSLLIDSGVQVKREYTGGDDDVPEYMRGENSYKYSYIYDGVTYSSETDAWSAVLLNTWDNQEDITDIEFSGGSSGGGSSSNNDPLDNYLKDAERRYKIHQDEEQYINDLIWAQNNLVKTLEEQLELEDKIEQARKDHADNRIKDIEHEIEMTKNLKGEDVDVTDKYKQIQNIAHEEANRLRAMGYDENSDEIQEQQKIWWDAQKNIEEIEARAREALENLATAHNDAYNNELSGIQKNIDNLEHKKSLATDADKIDAINDAITSEKQAYINLGNGTIGKLQSDADFHKGEIEKLLDSVGASFDISKWFDDEGNILAQFKADMDTLNDSKLEEKISSRVDIVSGKLQGISDIVSEIQSKEQEIFDQAQEELDKIKTIVDEMFDLRIRKLESESTILSSQHSLINSIAETQHQLDKDILEAETAGARMTESEKELLFSREEYNTLSGELNDVLADANALQEEFNRKLQGATLDTIDEITNHYERQFELKMKEYEVVKAQLEVAKAQQKLENVENEKSVRMWDGEKWVYTAVLQDVINAQNELADAKYQLAQTELEQKQTDAIHEIESEVDSLETQKNQFATALEELTGGVVASEENLVNALQGLADKNVPQFSSIIDKVGTSLEKLSAKISSVNVGSSNSGSSSDGIVGGNSGMHPLDANKISIAHELSARGRTYATGSKSTPKGLGLYDENGLGTEALITEDGVLRQFDSGETVFTEDMVGRLWDFASGNPIPWNFPTPSIPTMPSLVNRSEMSQPVYDNRTYFNGVEISDPDGIRIMKDFATYLKSRV